MSIENSYFIDNIKSEKIIIYKIGRRQKEFEYMFDDLDVVAYIDDDYHEDIYNGKKVYNTENLDEKIDNDEVIIICAKDEERDEIERYFKKINYEYKTKYFFDEDIFVLLDDYREDIVGSRKVAIWGTGETKDNLLKSLVHNNYDIDIEMYLDGDISKSGVICDGKMVKHISEIKQDLDNIYIIVASVFYYDIKKELEQYGLVEGKDFLSYSSFMVKPSKMMKELVNAKQYLNGPGCKRPFEWLYYAWFGVYCCCSTWVKYPIGNAISSSPEECWNSVTAKLYRLSMINKTYVFCKHDACPYIGSDLMPKELEITNDKDIVPKYLTLGIDYTCNLKCSSCRNEIIVASGNQLELRKRMINDIINTGWLEKSERVELSGAGEALFSKVYKPILYDKHTTKRKSISLLTNANLLDREHWDKLKSVYENIRVNISIDAATEETYNKIRRGGNWSVLMKNLEMLSQLRKSEELEYIEIRMVVQNTNYKEIIPFVKLGEKFNVDKVVFTKLLNWDMYSDEDYSEASMIKNEKIDKRLRDILMDPFMNKEIVVINEFKKYL